MIWVFGASGKLGKETGRFLVRRNVPVVGWGRGVHRPQGWKSDWQRWDHEERQPSQEPDVLPETIVWLAWQTSPLLARESPYTDLLANAGLLLGALDWCVSRNCFPHVVLAGSATEANLEKRHLPFDSLERSASSFYEVGKVAALIYLEQYAREYPMTFTHLRFSNLYGVPSISRNNRGFLDGLIQRASLGLDLRIKIDGDVRRDYLHVQDAAVAIGSVLFPTPSITNRVFDVGTGISTSIRSAVDAIVALTWELSSKTLHVDFFDVEMPPIDRLDRYVDPRSFAIASGWSHEFDLRSGIEVSLRGALAESRHFRGDS